MNDLSFCGCRVVDGKWMSACAQHEQRYADLQRLALAKYEQYRRNAYVPPVHEVSK